VDPMQNTPPASETQRQLTFTFWFSVLFACLVAVLGLSTVRTGRFDLLWSTVPSILAVLVGLWFTNRNRPIIGSSMLLV
jgi:hypothetical protein